MPCLAALTLLTPVLQSPSAKELFDRELAAVRPSQAADGSYGGRLETAWVVTALALCPRAYREDDGPFVRDAVAWLRRTAPPFEDPAGDLATALALQAVDAGRYGEEAAALARRHGVDPAVLARLVAGEDPALAIPDEAREPGGWLDGLPLPEAGESAVALLGGLAPETPRRDRLRALARAALAWRREQARKAAAARVDVAALYERGVDFLLSSRGESGLWEVFGQPEPGITALAARALLGSRRPEARQAAFQALDWLRSLQREDGSIALQGLPVYVTSVAIRALVAGGRPEDRPVVEKAAAWLKAVQADEGEGYSEADKFYGGIGYGNDLRPDLSNLQYALQALRDAGVGADDPAFQRALVFLQRSQNRSESNPGVYHDAGRPEPIRAGNDGGAVYYPGNSPAGYDRLPDGSLVARSYGSMTYALLKCYVFAGLSRDDPRVQAAVGWIRRHWTLEVNPGFDTLKDPRAGFQGLFYYYLSLAEALAAAGLDTVETPDGVRHDWRRELAAKLAELQRPDGSWVNEEATRWWEGNPVLCTAYALNALRVLAGDRP